MCIRDSLLLAEGLSQKRDKAKVFLYEISDEPGFLEPNKNSWTSCSYNYRVSEGRVAVSYTHLPKRMNRQRRKI